MIKKIITLIIIGRKLALSDALNIVSKVYKIPILIKIFFSLLGLFGKKKLNQNFNERKIMQIDGSNGHNIYQTWSISCN